MNSPAGASTQSLVSVRGLFKRYGYTDVLREVSLELTAGRCLALVGENGAGKSTLVKILSGLVSPTSGLMTWQGDEVHFGSPRDAQQVGIATIPQELAYVPDMTVAENLLIGRWPNRFAVTSRRMIQTTAQTLLQGLGLDLDANAVMADLSLAQRQLVEIAKALSTDARLVILDEPTASLNGVEAQRLLDMLTSLKAGGVSLLFVSHRLDECFQLADEIAVLRNGRVAARTAPAETSPDQVVNDMLGREYVKPQLASVAGVADEVPFVRLVDWTTDRVPRLHGVELAAHKGEVLSVFGLMGSGAESIARGLGGHGGTRIHGSLELGGVGQAPFRSPAAARRAGVGYVPAERKTDGLALGRPVLEALTVLVTDKVSRGGVMTRRRERTLAARLIERFGVRTRSPRQPVGELSGGNQQKVLLASRLAAEPHLLVLHEPTRGVDVAARSQIHELVVQTARSGAAVVVITSDVDEAVAVGDRLVVIRKGQVAAKLRGPQKTKTAVLMAATAAPGQASVGGGDGD
jgi:ABC-type sugar transport system ATPase subunit